LPKQPLARNGVEFGIQTSGTGDRWFTAPAPIVRRLVFPRLFDRGCGARSWRQCHHRALLWPPLSQSNPGATAVLVDVLDTSGFNIKSYAERLLKSQRIDDFEERELIEIGVAGRLVRSLGP